MIAKWMNKMTGSQQPPGRVNAMEIFWSWLGSFVGIGLLGVLHQYLFEPKDMMLILGSFGASAVLIYGAITSPLAQPRHLVGGHIISAIIGVTMYYVLGGIPWLAAACAVSLSVVAMQWSKTLHPPGGATALIAVIGSERIHAMGYFYVFLPVASGALLMLLIALIVNNLAGKRHYPLYW